MKKAIIFLGILSIVTLSYAEENILRADFRHRPPAMVIKEKNMSGPLKDIIEIAAEGLNYKIKWLIVPFPISLVDLKYGKIDILHRTIKTKAREAYVNYLGPIGYQQKDILFLVKKGQEGLINRYEDLKELHIAVKRGAAYFERFDNDTDLNKQANLDDDNMTEMFKMGRFNTMPVLDQSSLEVALKVNNVTNFTYANYKHIQKIGNYYGMSKNSRHAGIYRQLNQVLLDMAKSGRVAEIYQRYGIQPPVQQ